MTSIEELLAKPKTFETETIEVEVSGELVTLRFTEMSGEAWAEVTARCPVRPTVPLDTAYGYNVHAAAVLAAPESGVQVRGNSDESGDMVEVKWSDATWQSVLDRLSGSDFATLSSAIFGLNSWGPQQRVEALKKGSAAAPASKKKSPSRSTSASPRRSSGQSTAPKTSAG